MMMIVSVPVNSADVLWFALALCFLAALCAHTLSAPHLTGESAACRLHVLFQDLIRYGKTRQTLPRDHRLRVLDVPKRWFWHFYAVSVGWNGFLLVSYLSFTFQQQPYRTWLSRLIDTLTGAPASDSHVPQLSVLLVQLLLWVHSLRRLLECLFISVFSDGAIHLVQYLFGLGYYVALGLTVFCTDRLEEASGPLLSQLHWLHVAGVTVFLWASLMQHQSMVLLAQLRTGNSGSVQTLAHREPQGGWFQLVSCPHYFAELLIYVSLSLVFRGASLTWWLVVLYVLFNQALAAQLCHEHYISKFKSYPKHRKAFIPFVM